MVLLKTIYRWAQDIWRYRLSDWFSKCPALVSINSTRHWWEPGTWQSRDTSFLCHITWRGRVTGFIPLQFLTNLLRDPSNETGMGECAGDFLDGKNWKHDFIFEKIGIQLDHWVSSMNTDCLLVRNVTVQPCSTFVSEGNFCLPCQIPGAPSIFIKPAWMLDK